LKKLSPTKIVTRIHGPWFICGLLENQVLSSDDRYRIKLEGKAIISSNGVTAPSQNVLDNVREFYDFELALARVIPNPVMPVDNKDLWEDREPNEPSILYVGRFDRLKGADLMLLAFRIIALKYKEAVLKFAGPDNGFVINGSRYSLNEYVNKFIPERSIRDRINYLGICSTDTLKELRKKSTVTVVSSRYENFPLSLLEAMAAGCPVVATATGGINEIVVDQTNGLLADPESPESIAYLVQILFDDRTLRANLSKAAIECCKAEYAPQKIAREMGAYYKEMVDQ
jgi:glycosyltransferase involved in cell wall biosynthesis